MSQHFHHDVNTLPVPSRHNYPHITLTRTFNPDHITTGQPLPYRTYLLSHVGNLLHFRDLSPIPPDSPARTSTAAPPDSPTSPASPANHSPPTTADLHSDAAVPPPTTATVAVGPTYHRVPLLTLAYNVLPLHHLPHPLTFSSPFFLSLSAFSSSSLLLSNPFGPRGEKGREGLYSVRGEMRRERITCVVWVPSAMVRRRGKEQREKDRSEREQRREKEKRREADKREEKQRQGWKESDEQRKRRHRKEEERRRRDVIAEEQFRREEEEEEERAAYLTTQQQQQASEGRMGWDTFLVGYADGSVLAFDRMLDVEVTIAETSGGAAGEYMRVVRQAEPACNPTALYSFGHPHAPRSAITSLTFSTAGSLLCVTQSNGVCCVVDYHRSVLVACLAAYYGGWTCAAFTSDDALLLLGGEDDCVTIVETGRWVVVGRCEGHNGFISGIYLRAMTEAGVYRIVSAGEDGRLLFWEWIAGRRSRSTATAASASTAASLPKDNTHVYLRPYPSVASLRTIHPLAANHIHYGPISSLTGSHSYTRRRREYRSVYAIEADIMEVAADEEAAADCDECIVTAGWDWSIKVWAIGSDGAGLTASGGAAGEVRRRRGKRLSMRVIQPSPQFTDRRLYTGDVSERDGVSESCDGTGTSSQRRFVGSPMSMSTVSNAEPERLE